MKKRKINYPVEIRPLSENDGGGFVAIVPDLPGCMSDGDTMDGALYEVFDAIESWIRVAQEFGDPIPVPSNHFSGDFVVARIPADLYDKLSIRAKEGGISLDAYIVHKLSEAV